jgi:hypothetical protein
MVFLQNELQNSGGVTLYMVTPGVKYHILTQMTLNIGIIQITFQFGPFDNAK